MAEKGLELFRKRDGLVEAEVVGGAGGWGGNASPFQRCGEGISTFIDLGRH
jgi:hypothetical protein